MPEGVTGVAWSPDGATLGVSSDYGATLSTYDNMGRLLSSFRAKGNNGTYFNTFAFIDGASQVLFPIETAAPSETSFDIRDVKTGRIVRQVKNGQVRILAGHFAVSPDQKSFSTASEFGREIVTYRAENGRDWTEASIAKINGPKLAVASFTFFSDNVHIAVGESDGNFAIADSTTGEILKSFKTYDAVGIHDNIDGLAVSPKGDLILTGLHAIAISNDATFEAMAWSRSDHPVVSIWRVSDGKEVASFRDKGKVIDQAVWDPKDRFVAFIDTDSLIVWQPEAPGENYIRIKLPGLSASLAVTADGKSLAVAGGNKVIVYNIENN
jgi:WD40 repeat protein